MITMTYMLWTLCLCIYLLWIRLVQCWHQIASRLSGLLIMRWTNVNVAVIYSRGIVLFEEKRKRYVMLGLWVWTTLFISHFSICFFLSIVIIVIFDAIYCLFHFYCIINILNNFYIKCCAHNINILSLTFTSFLLLLLLLVSWTP